MFHLLWPGATKTPAPGGGASQNGFFTPPPPHSPPSPPPVPRPTKTDRGGDRLPVDREVEFGHFEPVCPVNNSGEQLSPPNDPQPQPNPLGCLRCACEIGR